MRMKTIAIAALLGRHLKRPVGRALPGVALGEAAHFASTCPRVGRAPELSAALPITVLPATYFSLPASQTPSGWPGAAVLRIRVEVKVVFGCRAGPPFAGADDGPLSRSDRSGGSKVMKFSQLPWLVALAVRVGQVSEGQRHVVAGRLGRGDEAAAPASAVWLRSISRSSPLKTPGEFWKSTSASAVGCSWLLSDRRGVEGRDAGAEGGGDHRRGFAERPRAGLEGGEEAFRAAEERAHRRQVGVDGVEGAAGSFSIVSWM